MSIKNCPECGRIFEFVFNNLCPECAKKEDEETGAVVAYLKDNAGSGIPEISEATGVSADKIIKMLKDGRLIAVCERHSIALLNCEHCGKPIIEGRFCPQCRDSISKVLSDKSGGTGQIDEKYTSDDENHTSKSKNAIKESDTANRFTSHFKY